MAKIEVAQNNLLLALTENHERVKKKSTSIVFLKMKNLIKEEFLKDVFTKKVNDSCKITIRLSQSFLKLTACFPKP